MTAVEHRPARSPGLSYQQLLDGDSRPVPDVLRAENPFDGGTADIGFQQVLHSWFRKERLGLR
mgnify:CR=1 FL=1